MSEGNILREKVQGLVAHHHGTIQAFELGQIRSDDFIAAVEELPDQYMAAIRAALLSPEAVEAAEKAVHRNRGLDGSGEKAVRAALDAAGITGAGQEGGEDE